ncbi:DUF1822 family protein [Calothrix sp. UHCC 0171]|uniref:DUF1822 family protein n=1 Tax=Calothrix sp. UHCC 0171 TaxID=3110245 RepID=UPI002B20615D|nr:DUF1822 family protein [Calothrix sp. UHCC 0171]MEA5572368.1 DUF1822 family protein [Calothrix sp. UHCC 0171]
MSRFAYERENFSLSLPISQSARTTAQIFAKQQPTSEKAEKVLLNTLSVLTVNYYLDLMGFATNLDISDIWNPVMRLCTDVSDLEVLGIGRLECRPINTVGDSCYIPPETWGERVAYIVVAIDETFLEAQILGFSTSVETDELTLNQLQPIEELPAYLQQYKQATNKIKQDTKPEIQIPVVVNLSHWFAGTLAHGWQTIESILSQPEYRPLYLFRSTESALTNRDSETMTATRCGKIIDLGIQIANQPVILVVEINTQENQKTNVRLQLHPTGTQIYLQSGVTLTVLDESGNIFLEAQSRSADNYIQLQFSGNPGERFSVKVGLDDASITEHFVI